MSLQPLLAEVDAAWLRDVDPRLLQKAKRSPLGQRLLSVWLMHDHAPRLFTPTPARNFGAIAGKWSRSRLAWLVRDLGILAYAPAVRGEVRRDPVRRLRNLLGNSYMLALDRSIWDGKVAPALEQRLGSSLGVVVASTTNRDDDIWELLELQGLQELRHWGATQEPELAEWAKLMAPPLPDGVAHLPPEPVRMLHDHHLARTMPN